MMKNLIGLMIGVFSGAAFSVDVTENLQMGASVRLRADYDQDRGIKKFGLDTLAPYIRYNSDTWIASARYRFYGRYYPYLYTERFGDVSFAEHAWLGYQFSDTSQLQLGLNQVPFGIQPYFSNSMAETLGYTIGLEDVNQLGAKYKTQMNGWDLQGGYYFRPAWRGKGMGASGVTYSNSPAQAHALIEEGSNNTERGLVALRVAKMLALAGWQTELGGSVLSASLRNHDVNKNGRRNAAAVHVRVVKGPWSSGFLAARQQMSPQNPGRRDVVTFGGYDSIFNIASRGNLLSADVNYDIGGIYLNGWLSKTRIYGSYSAFLKSEDQFKDSQRLVAGVSFSFDKSVYIATEWLRGRNDPYIGLNSYTQSLAAGGTNRWANQAKMSIGYTF